MVMSWDVMCTCQQKSGDQSVISEQNDNEKRLFQVEGVLTIVLSHVTLHTCSYDSTDLD